MIKIIFYKICVDRNFSAERIKVNYLDSHVIF